MADVLLLANPVCLARRGLTLAGLSRTLGAAGLTVEAACLDPLPDRAALGASIAARAPRLVVAAGGDGTVHHVAEAVLPLAMTLGIVPLGTANDFARTLGLPADPAAAVRVLATGVTVGVDVARVAERIFVNAAHAGLGADVARRTDPRLKRWLGPLAYRLAAWQAWRARMPLRLEICLDGGCDRLVAAGLLVCNGRFFGGGLGVRAEATLDDGLLDVWAFGPRLGAGEALRLLAAARRGELAAHPGLLRARTAHFTAHLSRPAELNLDGELVPLPRTLTFEVLPRALRVLAPAPLTAPREGGGGSPCTVA